MAATASVAATPPTSGLTRDGQDGIGSVINLNGGILSTARPIQDGSTGNSIVNFNGGTLQLGVSTTIFNALTVNVFAGGATFDTQGFSDTVGVPLNGAGGVTSTSSNVSTPGTLTLSNASTFAGGLTVTSGTLNFNAANTATTGNILVTGGTLNMNAAYSTTGTLTVNGGTTTLGATNAFIGSSIVLGGTGGILNYNSTNAFNGSVTVGEGTLNFNALNGFTSNLTINGGSVIDNVADNQSLTIPTTSGLGNLSTVGRQIIVNSGGTLRFGNNDAMGSNQILIPTSIVVNGGTISHGNGFFVSIGNITLENGATMTGGSGANGSYDGWDMTGTVTVSGTSGSTITTTGGTNFGFHLGSDPIASTGNTNFVVNTTGGVGPDLTVSVPLINQADDPQNGQAAGFAKMGTGTMLLASEHLHRHDDHPARHFANRHRWIRELRRRRRQPRHRQHSQRRGLQRRVGHVGYRRGCIQSESRPRNRRPRQHRG